MTSETSGAAAAILFPPTGRLSVRRDYEAYRFYQLGGGTYLRAAPIWSYNFENDDYSVPLGVGIGQVIKKGKTVYNVFAEPQFSVADSGAGQPVWQVFVGFNMQFLD